jgi:hypothetical protein
VGGIRGAEADIQLSAISLQLSAGAASRGKSKGAGAKARCYFCDIGGVAKAKP